MQWGEIWKSATQASMEELDFPHTCFSIACTRWGNAVIKLHQKFSLGSRRAQRTILKCIWQFRYWARSYFDKAYEQKCGWYWADHYQSGDTLEHTNTWTTCQERYRHCRHCRQLLLLLFLLRFGLGMKCTTAQDKITILHHDYICLHNQWRTEGKKYSAEWKKRF